MKDGVTGPRNYKLISADGHLMDPPDLWTSQAPAKYRDQVPRMERFEQGDAWVMPGQEPRARSTGWRVPVARPTSRVCWCRLEDINPGCYDAKARVEALDLDGVDAELLFPNGLDWVVDSTDRDFHLTMTRIYNDHCRRSARPRPSASAVRALLPPYGVDDADRRGRAARRDPGHRGVPPQALPDGDPRSIERGGRHGVGGDRGDGQARRRST